MCSPLELFPIHGKEILNHRDYFRTRLSELGTFRPQEKRVLIIFAVVILLWLSQPLHKVPDSSIAIFGALLLFILPADKSKKRLLNWDTAKNIRWDILILFGGGLSLAGAIQRNGVANICR